MAELSHTTLGDPGAPAVMLLHGFLSSRSQWLANQKELAVDHHLVMVELWGHGSSPEPDSLDQYSVDGYVQQFERIRERLEIESWTLIGQSYGAGLTIHYALRHPERCAGVVVTNSRSAFGELTARERRTAEADSDSGKSPLDDPSFELRSLPYHPVHARRFPAAVKEALVEAADAMSVSAVRNGGRLGARLGCAELLGDLSVPILLTNGMYETSFQVDLARLRSRYPELTVCDMEGGHSVNVEAATEFNVACRRFLSDVAGGNDDSYRLRTVHLDLDSPGV